MAVVNDDYQTCIDACRRCLMRGTTLTGVELKKIVEVIQDASAKQVTADAQIALLQAIDAVTQGATMNTAVDTADAAIGPAATVNTIAQHDT